MMMIQSYSNLGRLYGECILYWVLENAIELGEVDDYQMREGSGLDDVQYKIGLNWLIEHRLLEKPQPEILQ